jgi:rubrerythrin
MHDGCAGGFGNGKEIVNKLRMMGFSGGILPEPFSLDCHHCGKPMQMATFEFACPACGAVHGVTPCHSFSAEHVQCAGPGY